MTFLRFIVLILCIAKAHISVAMPPQSYRIAKICLKSKRATMSPVEDEAFLKKQRETYDFDAKTNIRFEMEKAGFEITRHTEWQDLEPGTYVIIVTDRGTFASPAIPFENSLNDEALVATHRALLRRFTDDKKIKKIYFAGEFIFEKIGEKKMIIEINNKTKTFMGTTAVSASHLEYGVDVLNMFRAPIDRKNNPVADLSNYLIKQNEIRTDWINRHRKSNQTELESVANLHVSRYEMAKGLVLLRNCNECAEVLQKWESLLRYLRKKYPHPHVPSQPNFAFLEEHLEKLVDQEYDQNTLDLLGLLHWSNPENPSGYYDMWGAVYRRVALAETPAARMNGANGLSRIIKAAYRSL